MLCMYKKANFLPNCAVGEELLGITAAFVIDPL